MSDSNWTLRTPRTSREAYGHWVGFEKHDPDKCVAAIGILALVFVLGFLAGAA